MSHLFVLLESDEVLYSEQWGDMFVFASNTQTQSKKHREKVMDFISWWVSDLLNIYLNYETYIFLLKISLILDSGWMKII